MEKITNKDLKEAKDRKFMTESKTAVGKIGKDNKIDTSKMKMRPDAGKKGLADAYRFKMGLPKSMSDAQVIKMFQNQGVSDQDAALKQRIKQKNIKDKQNKKEKLLSNPRMSDRDLQLMEGLSDRDAQIMLGKKAGGTKMNKKSIMELPTNVPRLMKGALLGDLNKDGKMSGYETARQKAITKSMNEQKPKAAKTGISFLDDMQKDSQDRRRLRSFEKSDFEEITNLITPKQKSNLGKNLRNIQKLGGDGQVNKTVRKFLKNTGGPKAQKIAKKAGNPQLQEKQGFIGAAGANKRKK